MWLKKLARRSPAAFERPATTIAIQVCARVLVRLPGRSRGWPAGGSGEPGGPSGVAEAVGPSFAVSWRAWSLCWSVWWSSRCGVGLTSPTALPGWAGNSRGTTPEACGHTPGGSVHLSFMSGHTPAEQGRQWERPAHRGWQHSWQHLLSTVADVTADLSRATSLGSSPAGDCTSPRGCHGRRGPCRGSSATGSHASRRVARTAGWTRGRARPRLLALPGTHPYAGVVRVLVRFLVRPGSTGTVSGENRSGRRMPGIGRSVEGCPPVRPHRPLASRPVAKSRPGGVGVDGLRRVLAL